MPTSRAEIQTHATHLKRNQWSAREYDTQVAYLQGSLNYNRVDPIVVMNERDSKASDRELLDYSLKES